MRAAVTSARLAASTAAASFVSASVTRAAMSSREVIERACSSK